MKDFLGYQNQICVVVGASSSMGKATASMLVELGAKVYALDWNPCDVEGINAFVHIDLSKKESIDEAMKQLPEHIDAFFGIAGVSGSRHDFLTTVSIDFISNKYICENYLNNRMEKGGAIAFMSSVGGNDWEKNDNKSVLLPIISATTWDDVVNAICETNLQYSPGTLAYLFSKLAINYYTAYYLLLKVLE